MAYIRRTGGLAVLVCLISHVWIAATYTIKYCANINTASTNANYSIYQSDGLCANFCPGYSYAILQDSACYCSNYTPDSSTTTSLSNCNISCGGYPPDICGGNNLYTYVFLDKNPAGTKNVSQTSTTDATSKETTSTATQILQSTETVQGTTTVQDTVTTSSPTSDSSNSSSKTPAATATDSSSTQTVTVAPGGSATSKGLSTGAIVGIVVGVVFAVAGVGALVLLVWWRKRREREAEAAADHSPRSSSAGMVSTMASMGEVGTRRGSKFIPIDDRMEFNANLYNRGDGNPSSDSVNSLRDDRDYSRRVLRTTNPDPPAQP